ncbi:unnamed protein product [Oikopleura dioica]|uniref:Chromo domain-containing protein n=1 Tax=Oikopleura dioica TaxID=34765 RepID=E4Z050_OIKDI|nr:unnamed protein product [Oikopleura dioica]
MGTTKRGRSAAGSKRKAAQPTRKSDRAKRSYVPRDDDGVIVQVLAAKKIGGVDHFKVKWSDDVRPNSWEPAKKVLKVAKSLVDEYQANEPTSDSEVPVTPKKSASTQKRGKSPTKTKKESVDDLVMGRSIKAGRVEYKFKKAGKTKAIPLYKLDKKELDAVQSYERNIQSDNSTDLSAEESGGSEVYTVQKILNRKGAGKNRRYLIRWEGYNKAHDTWEPITNIEPARKMANAFDKKQDTIEAENADKDFEVEKIVEEKIRRNKPCFLVKWNGYPVSFNTWQSAESLQGCSSILDAWEVQKQKRLESQRIAREKREKKKEERKAKQAKEKQEAAEKAATEASKKSADEDNQVTAKEK